MSDQIQQEPPAIIAREADEAVYTAAKEMGYSDIVARVLAGRLEGASALGRIRPGLSDLESPFGLPGIREAGEMLATTIMCQGVVAVVCDHDCDGLDACAVLVDTLMSFGLPRDHIRCFISHRLNEGYGLSDSVAQRILESPVKPSVVITADHGSSDEPRISQLAEHGIPCIVTDHHRLPEAGPPASALECVTPKHPDSTYPDTAIAGVMVAWLVMSVVRRVLIEWEWEPAAKTNMAATLDFVALGTVADCVSLGTSINNRIVVNHGLERIVAGTRPCWRIARERGWIKPPFGAESLSFGIGPHLNSKSRTSSPGAGAAFLLAKTDEDARHWADVLEESNRQRKQIEKDLVSTAKSIAAEQVEEGRSALVLFLKEGHTGVHGIVASRVVEAYGRPTICLSPQQGEEHKLKGSARGVDGVDIQQALVQCDQHDPSLFNSHFGGHEGAGGMEIARDRLSDLEQWFDEAVRHQLVETAHTLGPKIYTDGSISGESITLELVEELHSLQPYGRGFDNPRFEGLFFVKSSRSMGDGSHWRLSLKAGETVLEGVWFNATEAGAEQAPIHQGCMAHIVFEPQINHFKNKANLQLVIRFATALGMSARDLQKRQAVTQ